MHPHVTRTSPAGQQFVGTCTSCGKTGITSSMMFEDCENPRDLSTEDALVEAVEDDGRRSTPQRSDPPTQVR
jgi:hypothetical protein